MESLKKIKFWFSKKHNTVFSIFMLSIFPFTELVLNGKINFGIMDAIVERINFLPRPILTENGVDFHVGRSLNYEDISITMGSLLEPLYLYNYSPQKIWNTLIIISFIEIICIVNSIDLYKKLNTLQISKTSFSSNFFLFHAVRSFNFYCYYLKGVHESNIYLIPSMLSAINYFIYYFLNAKVQKNTVSNIYSSCHQCIKFYFSLFLYYLLLVLSPSITKELPCSVILIIPCISTFIFQIYYNHGIPRKEIMFPHFKKLMISLQVTFLPVNNLFIY
jgi:hypothetical protein